MTVRLLTGSVLLILLWTLTARVAARRSSPEEVNVSCHGVFFPGLGCFSRDPPFNNTRWAPQQPSYIQTSFLLYTRGNPTVADRLHVDNSASITSSHLDGQLPVKLLVHGFLQHGHSEFLLNMTRALLAYAPMNVIVVGWGGGAGFPYTQAVANTRVVGAEIARMLPVLIALRGVTLDRVHIIGHSLGAHVAGYVGAKLPGVARISALDPAQPNFSKFPVEVRLDPSDARFVDVIHTDGSPYDTVGGYGMIEPVGHVDFYPNGGHDQPGCHEDSSIMDFMEDAYYRGMTNAELGMSCSHERSTQLFTASITTGGSLCSFTAFPCSSEAEFMRGACLHCGNRRPCPVMGLHAGASFRPRGSFYLNTTGVPPFCGHHYFVKLTLDTSMTYADGDISVRLTGDQGHSDWTLMKSGRLSAGDVISGLVLLESHSDLGSTFGVEVKFIQESGMFRWSIHQVALRRVEVDSALRFPTKYFCQPEMTLEEGRDLTLNSPTFEASHCS